MSLFAEYIKERLDKEIMEDHRGFATYCFIDDGCYIEDIFVKKEFRDQDIAKEMLDKISVIAKERNISKLIGTVVPSANGSTDSLSAAFSYGFKLDSSSQNLIVFTKDLKVN